MAYSLKTEQEHFYNMLDGKIDVKPTRALVVSTRDPLFCGRVKVWIPAIHGLNSKKSSESKTPQEPQLPDGGYDLGDLLIDTDFLLNLADPAFVGDDTEKGLVSQQRLIISGLPWAKSLGNNWGPTFSSTKQGLISGVFSVPKIGSEVYVIFEDNNPDLPIIVGSIIHTNEFAYKPNLPVEIYPGMLINKDKKDTAKTFEDINDNNYGNEYIKDVSSGYSIRAENGSNLLISDALTSSCILLRGAIRYSDKNQMSDDVYSNYKQAYPGFPTTKSSPFSVRTPITSNIINRAVNNKLVSTPSGGATISQIPADTGSTTILPKQNEPLSSVKMWPVIPPPGKAIPLYSTDTGYNGGAFKAGRSYGQHIGLDIIGAGAGTILVAPIALIPMKYWNSPEAGLTLVCYSPVDGTGHGFCHLQSIHSGIVQLINDHAMTIIPAGNQLGLTGKSGTAAANNKYGHLHWEVYKNPGKDITTVEDFMKTMYSAAHSKAGVNACIDPVLWIRDAGPNLSTPSHILAGSPENIRSMVNNTAYHYTSNDAADLRKPVGLEICTVPGKETVILRHSSGSYLGFDHDGNFIMFSAGDANIKINRSWNLDVLGGILETCHAKFTRVRTVFKEWSRRFTRGIDLETADKTYPDFFVRAENQREIDINDAMRSSISNAYYVKKDEVTGETIQSKLTEAFKPGAPYTVAASTVAKDFGNTKYDSAIQKAYDKYINTQELKNIFPDWRLFKAQMLKESNGDYTAFESKTKATGLFQLTPIAIADVLGSTSKQSNMSAYQDVVTNIEMSFRVTLKNYYSYIKSAINNRNSRLNVSTYIKPNDIKDLCFLSYIAGGPSIGQLINSRSLDDDFNITYGDIEALYKQKYKSYEHSLSYAPTIDWIYDNLTK